MKVLLIDVNCKNSSTGKIVYDLYQGLTANGYGTAVCYGRGPMIEEKNIYKFGLDWETNIHAGLARITGLNGCFSPFSTERLIAFMEKFKPDIVHIHELHAYFVNIAPVITYLKEKKIKVIWTFHCEYMYTGKCGHSYDCEKWKTSCGSCPSVHDYPKSFYFDFTKRMFDKKKALLTDFDFTIVTPSQWLADRVRQSFLADKPILVIHNGIDTEHVFYPRDTTALREKYRLGDKKVVLSVAPNIMDERKGGKWVLELSKRSELAGYQFVLVGADETKQISPNVLMVKRTTSQDELAEWYSLASCFVICSKRETFSLVTVESLCCGTPVVGFRSGAPETIALKEYSAFVGYRDIDELSCVVATWLSRNKDRNVIAKAAQALFSKENMCEQYIDLYKRTYAEDSKQCI